MPHVTPASIDCAVGISRESFFNITCIWWNLKPEHVNYSMVHNVSITNILFVHICYTTLSHDLDTNHAEKGCVWKCAIFTSLPWMFRTSNGIKQEPMAMQKLHIFQLSAASELGKHSACSLMLPRS